MKIHPLQYAYMKAVKELYHKPVGFGKHGDPYTKAVELAAKVDALGIDYEIYMKSAVNVCLQVTADNKWPYPYWNVVSSDWVYNRIKKIVKELEWHIDENDRAFDAADLELELVYATNYFSWLNGDIENKPTRYWQTYPHVINKAIDYIKKVYGISGRITTYDQLFKAITWTR